MSESKTITLSKLKGMSGADILSLIETGGIAVEINGVHVFDLVRPLNALDKRFLDVSGYVADEVSIELKRKIETLRVGDMFNPKNVQDVLNATAAVVEVQEQPVEEVVAEKPKPKAKPKPKKRAAAKVVKNEEKPIVPAAAIEANVTEVSADEAEVLTDVPFDTLSDDDLALAPFPDNTHEEQFVYSTGLDADDAEGQDEAPAAALFEDLLLDEDDNLVAEVETLAADLPNAPEAEEEDPFEDDVPLVRKLARKK